MRRRLVAWPCALALMLAASACAQSEDDRARAAALRAREEASTRESEVVARVSTPRDPHRILYHAPTDLSDTSAKRTGATIEGLAKAPQATKPAPRGGSPPPTPPR